MTSLEEKRQRLMTITEKRQRLTWAREQAGYRSARQAALTMGWTYPTYASHESGLRDFPQKVAERYARAFRVSPEFIMFGTNPPDRASDINEPEMGEVRAPTRSLRLFSDTEADGLREWLEKPTAGKQFVITDPGNLSIRSIALTISTSEMRAKPAIAGEREILPGDTVIIDAERRHVRPGDTIALLVDNDPDVHLRKVTMRPGGQIVYVALNCDYGELQSATVIGRVMWVIAAT